MANRPHMICATVTVALAITVLSHVAVLSLVDLTSELKRMDSVNHEQEAFTEKEEDDHDETSLRGFFWDLELFTEFCFTRVVKTALPVTVSVFWDSTYGLVLKQDGIVYGMDAAWMDSLPVADFSCFWKCEAAYQGGLITSALVPDGQGHKQAGTLIVYDMDECEYDTVTADDSNTASSSVFQLTSGNTEIEFQLTYVEFRFELAFMNKSDDPATEDCSSMAIIIRNERSPIRKVAIGILSVPISTNVSYQEKTSTSYPAAVPSEFGHMIMLALTSIIIMVNSISRCITLNHADTQTLHGMQIILQHMIRKSISTCPSESDPAAADEDHPNNTAPSGNTLEPIWNVASAAVHHMTGNLSLLLTGGYSPMNNGEDLLVHAGNNTGKPLRVHGSGSVRTESIALDDVWYVPGLDSNLVSTGQLARLGCAITLGPGGCRITMGGGDALVGSARFADGYLYVLDFLKVAS